MKDKSVYIAHGTGMHRFERITSPATPWRHFLRIEKTQDAVVRNLEVIGQALKDYGIDALAEKRPHIPSSQVAGMRNILAHDYLGVDMVMIWDTVQSHLNELQQAFEGC